MNALRKAAPFAVLYGLPVTMLGINYMLYLHEVNSSMGPIEPYPRQDQPLTGGHWRFARPTPVPNVPNQK